MAAKCVEDLKAAVDAVKAEYGNDPKWKSVIDHGDEALKAAESVEAPAESPGQKAANEVHAEENKPETPEEEKKETPEHENSESPKDEEHPKDMKGAAKIALLMLRNKK